MSESILQQVKSFFGIQDPEIQPKDLEQPVIARPSDDLVQSVKESLEIGYGYRDQGEVIYPACGLDGSVVFFDRDGQEVGRLWFDQESETWHVRVGEDDFSAENDIIFMTEDDFAFGDDLVLYGEDDRGKDATYRPEDGTLTQNNAAFFQDHPPEPTPLEEAPTKIIDEAAEKSEHEKKDCAGDGKSGGCHLAIPLSPEASLSTDGVLSVISTISGIFFPVKAKPAEPSSMMVSPSTSFTRDARIFAADTRAEHGTASSSAPAPVGVSAKGSRGEVVVFAAPSENSFYGARFIRSEFFETSSPVLLMRASSGEEHVASRREDLAGICLRLGADIFGVARRSASREPTCSPPFYEACEARLAFVSSGSVRAHPLVKSVLSPLSDGISGMLAAFSAASKGGPPHLLQSAHVLSAGSHLSDARIQDRVQPPHSSGQRDSHSDGDQGNSRDQRGDENPEEDEQLPA